MCRWCPSGRSWPYPLLHGNLRRQFQRRRDQCRSHRASFAIRDVPRIQHAKDPTKIQWIHRECCHLSVQLRRWVTSGQDPLPYGGNKPRLRARRLTSIITQSARDSPQYATKNSWLKRKWDERGGEEEATRGLSIDGRCFFNVTGPSTESSPLPMRKSQYWGVVTPD